MDFVRSYFFTNETLGSWTLFSSRLDSLAIKTLERHSLNVKKCVSNVLITKIPQVDLFLFVSWRKLKTPNVISILTDL